MSDGSGNLSVFRSTESSIFLSEKEDTPEKELLSVVECFGWRRKQDECAR